MPKVIYGDAWKDGPESKPYRVPKKRLTRAERQADLDDRFLRNLITKTEWRMATDMLSNMDFMGEGFIDR
jgi:hypothetical protein